jgi:dTDP-4-amino-4,6-dideoxygalactose transaminase
MNSSLGQSPFFIPIIVSNEFEPRKVEIAKILQAEGISLLSEFNNIVADWDITQKLNWKVVKSSNARSMKARSFNLFLNENYGEREATEIVEALEKILNFLKNP